MYVQVRSGMTSVVGMPSAGVEQGRKGNAAGFRGRFMEVYQQLKKELLADSELVTYTDDSRAWVEEVGFSLVII